METSYPPCRKASRSGVAWPVGHGGRPFHDPVGAEGLAGHGNHAILEQEVHLYLGMSLLEGAGRGRGHDEIAEGIRAGDEHPARRRYGPFIQDPQTGVLPPGGPGAAPGDDPAGTAVEDPQLDHERLRPLGHHLEASQEPGGAPSLGMAVLCPDPAEPLDLGEVAGGIRIAVVFDHTVHPHHLHISFEFDPLVDGALPTARSGRPEPHLAVGVPSAVPHPAPAVVRQPVDLPHTPRPCGIARRAGDVVQDGGPGPDGEGLIRIEAEDPLPLGLRIGLILRGRPPLPSAGHDPRSRRFRRAGGIGAS